MAVPRRRTTASHTNPLATVAMPDSWRELVEPAADLTGLARHLRGACRWIVYEHPTLNPLPDPYQEPADDLDAVDHWLTTTAEQLGLDDGRTPAWNDAIRVWRFCNGASPTC